MSYATRTFHDWVTATVMIFAAFALPHHASAGCKLAKIADLPVTMSDMKPMITAKINGMDASFVADSGAFYSMLSPASAAEFKLKTYPVPLGLRVAGIGGEASVAAATVKTFMLAGVPISNVEFLVGGGEVGGDGVGVLGQNVFRIGDVEYDLANGAIRLMQEDHCGNANFAYWVAGTSQAYSVMDIQWTSPQSPHTAGVALVNGVKIRVMFDTGASTSYLSRRAAERAGIKIDAPGVVDEGNSRGIGRDNVKTWIAPVADFKLGGEEIRNTRLRIAESLIDSTDMLIGADFFLSHRIYVASKQRKLFFTYNGGPVFNLASTPSPSSSGSMASSASAERPPADAAPDVPKDAGQFSRRGTAFAAHRDFDRAIADLTRACELAPEEADYFYERGMVRWKKEQLLLAAADFGRAIELKPNHVAAHLARAQLRLTGREVSQAIEDLEAADLAVAKEADVRLRIASAYVRADLWAPAIAQLDLWIAAHAADARMAGALNERCRMRAFSGVDLSKALKDCDCALGLAVKADANRAKYLDSRGLVWLRLGNFEKSIADYDASLRSNPKDPWALYGRGVAQLRRGKASAGRADLVAATAVSPQIADAFEKRGIHP